MAGCQILWTLTWSWRCAPMGLETDVALETGRGEFALAIVLGIVLLLLALMVNAALGLASANAARHP